MNSEKKSLFVTNQFETGGVETVFYNLTSNLEINALLFPLHANTNKQLIEALPDNVTLVKNRYHLKRSLIGLVMTGYAAIRYRKRFRNTGVSIINFSDTLSTLLFSYILSPKNVNSWIHCNPEALKNAATYPIYWWLLGRCKNLIFISESQKELFFMMKESRHIDPKKAIVCTNFIDAEINKKADQPIKIEQPFFFIAARLDLRSKDYLTLIEAYALLPERIREIYPLVIAGDGPDKEIIKKYIKNKGVEDRIILLGNVLNPFSYMSKATVVIHASISEGFAMSILEALACGATVVAADCHVGPSEILDQGHYGYLYEPGNAKRLAEQIDVALSSKISPDVAKKRAFEITQLGINQAKEFLENEN